MTNTVNIPTNMVPEDGRFGSGPSKIRPEQVQALDAGAQSSGHLAPPDPGQVRWSAPSAKACPYFFQIARRLRGRARQRRRQRLLGHRLRVAHHPQGRHSARTAHSARKFAKSAQIRARSSKIRRSSRAEPGTYRLPELTEYRGRLLLGAQRDVHRRVRHRCKRVEGTKEQGALTLIDATSGAGALPVDISQTDAVLPLPAEGVRLPTAACGSPCSSPPPSNARLRHRQERQTCRAHAAGFPRSSR